MGIHGSLFAEKCVLVFLLAFSVAPFSLTEQAREGSQNGDEHRVLALEVLWNQAELKRDVRALDQLLADRFTYTDIDGTYQHRSEFLDSVRNSPEEITSIGNESMAAEVYDNTVVVTGIYLEKGNSRGKPYSRRGRFTDTWVRQGDQWKCVASHASILQK
jgi:hypothetical protein